MYVYMIYLSIYPFPIIHNLSIQLYIINLFIYHLSTDLPFYLHIYFYHLSTYNLAIYLSRYLPTMYLSFYLPS